MRQPPRPSRAGQSAPRPPASPGAAGSGTSPAPPVPASWHVRVDRPGGARPEPATYSLAARLAPAVRLAEPLSTAAPEAPGASVRAPGAATAVFPGTQELASGLRPRSLGDTESLGRDGCLDTPLALPQLWSAGSRRRSGEDRSRRTRAQGPAPGPGAPPTSGRRARTRTCCLVLPALAESAVREQELSRELASHISYTLLTMASVGFQAEQEPLLGHRTSGSR